MKTVPIEINEAYPFTTWLRLLQATAYARKCQDGCHHMFVTKNDPVIVLVNAKNFHLN
jgi:hypothetical protein